MENMTEPPPQGSHGENLVLGYLFGYSDLEPKPGIPPMTPLPDSRPMKDALIVSIHVDSTGSLDELSADQTFRIGVAIFDPRDLVIHERRENSANAIRSYYFSTHDDHINPQRIEHTLGPVERETLPLQAIARRLRVLTHGRRYILAGYDPENTIRFLRRLHKPIVTQACYIVDVAKAAHFTMLPSSASDLGTVLDILYVTPVLLYGATCNRAHDALRALLMCAVRDGEGKLRPRSGSERVTTGWICDALNRLIHGGLGEARSYRAAFVETTQADAFRQMDRRHRRLKRAIRKSKGSLVRIKDSRTPAEDSSDLNDAPTDSDVVLDLELEGLTISDQLKGQRRIKTTVRGRQRIRRAK